LLYCFETPDTDAVDATSLLRRVTSGDIDPKELVIGGTLAETDTGSTLKDLGAEVTPGVKAAAVAMLGRLRGELT
jgi:CRISPR-associated protein Cst2